MNNILSKNSLLLANGTNVLSAATTDPTIVLACSFAGADTSTDIIDLVGGHTLTLLLDIGMAT